MKKMSVYTEAFFVHSVLRRPRMDLVTYGGQQLLKTDARSGLQQKRVASVSSTLSPKPFNGGPLCLLTDQTKYKSHIPPPLKECYSKSNAYPCYTVD